MINSFLYRESPHFRDEFVEKMQPLSKIDELLDLMRTLTKCDGNALVDTYFESDGSLKQLGDD